LTTDPKTLSRRIARSTAAVWIAGVVAFAALSSVVAGRGHQSDVDSQLRAHALAAYGLGWWDLDGVFHDEVLHKEPELIQGPVRISFATPDGLAFGPPDPDQKMLVRRAMETEEPVWLERGRERTVAIAAYGDDDRVRGAVIASMSTGAARRATARFAAVTSLAALVLIGVGLAMSHRLARRLLAALQASIAEREQILAGAAHELRNPMAALLARIDSTPEGGAETALPEIRGTAKAATGVVERLLTWSRLAHATPAMAPVRLDLLVELCLEDDESLDAEPTVVDGDAELLEVAVRNLIENARVHGGGVERVRVADGRVEVLDRGEGIADDRLLEPFTKGATSPGSGLGLALARRIADRHGGHLEVSPAVALVLPVRAS
jgi:signal transduction histidine kinase